MTLVIVGGGTEPELEEGLGVLLDSGFQLARWLSPWDEADAVLPLRGDSVTLLKDADAQNIKYVLVHVGAADGRAGGSHDRAHHRVDVAQLRELAHQLLARGDPDETGAAEHQGACQISRAVNSTSMPSTLFSRAAISRAIDTDR